MPDRAYSRIPHKMAFTAATANGKRRRQHDRQEVLPAHKRARVPAPEDIDSDLDELEDDDDQDDAASDLSDGDIQASGKQRLEQSSSSSSTGSLTSDEDDPPSEEDLGFEHDASDDQQQVSDEDNGPKEEEEEEEEEEAESDDGEEQAQKEAMKSIAFGALANAQDELTYNPTQARKRDTSGRDDKLQALRDRLAELRARKPSKQVPQPDLYQPKSKSAKSPRSHKPEKNSEVDAPIKQRSKHAPAEQSSKHQVSRRRQVVDTAGHLPSNAQGGDPRFSAAAGPLDRAAVSRRYAFLDSYAAAELTAMKKQLAEGSKARKTSRGNRGSPLMSAAEQAQLKVEIGRMENRAAAKAKRAREDEIRREHNRRERGKVAEGKKPFFLKKGAARRMVEREQWDGLASKDRKKREERRIKRHEGKQVKLRPGERRSFVPPA